VALALRANRMSHDIEKVREAYENLFFGNICLLGFDVFEAERKYGCAFQKDMFARSNNKAMEVVLHFLFSRLDQDRANQVFRDIWPILDRDQARLFRKASLEWWSEIHRAADLTTIRASHLQQPGGTKFLSLLYELSSHILLEVTIKDCANASVTFRPPRLVSVKASSSDAAIDLTHLRTTAEDRASALALQFVEWSARAAEEEASWKLMATNLGRRRKQLSSQKLSLESEIANLAERKSSAALERGKSMQDLEAVRQSVAHLAQGDPQCVRVARGQPINVTLSASMLPGGNNDDRSSDSISLHSQLSGWKQLAQCQTRSANDLPSFSGSLSSTASQQAKAHAQMVVGLHALKRDAQSMLHGTLSQLEASRQTVQPVAIPIPATPHIASLGRNYPSSLAAMRQKGVEAAGGEEELRRVVSQAPPTPFMRAFHGEDRSKSRRQRALDAVEHAEHAAVTMPLRKEPPLPETSPRLQPLPNLPLTPEAVVTPHPSTTPSQGHRYEGVAAQELALSTLSNMEVLSPLRRRAAAAAAQPSSSPSRNPKEPARIPPSPIVSLSQQQAKLATDTARALLKAKQDNELRRAFGTLPPEEGEQPAILAASRADDLLQALDGDIYEHSTILDDNEAWRVGESGNEDNEPEPIGVAMAPEDEQRLLLWEEGPALQETPLPNHPTPPAAQNSMDEDQDADEERKDVTLSATPQFMHPLHRGSNVDSRDSLSPDVASMLFTPPTAAKEAIRNLADPLNDDQLIAMEEEENNAGDFDLLADLQAGSEPKARDRAGAPSLDYFDESPSNRLPSPTFGSDDPLAFLSD
jgi:hypothetical protein